MVARLRWAGAHNNYYHLNHATDVKLRHPYIQFPFACLIDESWLFRLLRQILSLSTNLLIDEILVNKCLWQFCGNTLQPITF